MNPDTWLAVAERYAVLAVVHATVLALLTWLICLIVRTRIRPALLAALWTIVLAKFLLPPVLPGELSLSGWLADAALHQTLAPSEPPPLSSGEAMELLSPLAGSARAPLSGVVETSMSSTPWTARSVLAGCYVAGLGVVGLRWLVRRRRMSRLIRTLREADAATAAEVQALAHRMGLWCGPAVRCTDESVSPFITGFWRPVLVLPFWLDGVAAGAAREALILHELAHLRRGDLLIRGVENAARVLLYFWPPVWWVCRQIERFSEMACDQWAVLVSQVCPDAYAQSLLSVARTCSSRSLPGRSALAFARHGRHLEERFTMILERTTKGPRYPWLAAPVMVAWAVFALTGGATAQDKPEPGKAPQAPAQEGPPARPNIDLDQPVPPERAKVLLEQYGEEGIDANGDGTLTRREVFEFFRRKGLPLPGRPGGAPGQERPAAGRPGQGRPGSGPTEMVDLFERFLRIESGKISRERILNAQPRADANQDGSLSDEEFAKALDFAHQMAVRRLLEALPATDKNGDGQLDDDEVTAFKTQTLERLSQRILASNKDADLDGDGKLSEDEFLTFREAQAAKAREDLLKRHPEADTDKDGTLSEEEFRAAEQKLRESSWRGRGGAGGPPGERRPLPGELKQDAPAGGAPPEPARKP